MKVQIGTVSSGTLRSEDLMESFASELRHLSDGNHTESGDKLLAEVDAIDRENYDYEEECHVHDLVEALIEELSERAPAHVYFGAHEGDGAEFGFWPDLDFIGCTTEIVSEGPNGASDMVDIDCQIHISVNDHGNTTVSELRGDEIWSAV